MYCKARYREINESVLIYQLSPVVQWYGLQLEILGSRARILLMNHFLGVPLLIRWSTRISVKTGRALYTASSLPALVGLTLRGDTSRRGRFSLFSCSLCTLSPNQQPHMESGTLNRTPCSTSCEIILLSSSLC